LDSFAVVPSLAAWWRPSRETYEVQSQALPAGTESPSPTTRYGPGCVGDGDGDAGSVSAAGDAGPAEGEARPANAGPANAGPDKEGPDSTSARALRGPAMSSSVAAITRPAVAYPAIRAALPAPVA
jgi:hypothetical protein